LPPTVARFEPPANDGLRAAIEEFDCVAIVGEDGKEDPGEVMVRDFLRSGDCERAAATGTTTTYVVLDPKDAPGKLIGYVTLSLTQLRLSGRELKGATAAAICEQVDIPRP
jgi:hypothetical protein